MKPNSRALRVTAGVLAALFLLSSASGCWGKRELEDRSFVTLIGVDLSDNGSLLITAEIAVPRAAGGGKMGGGGGGTSSLVLSGEGKNVLEAIDKIEVVKSRDLTTTHMSFVILGEEFARTDVSPIIDVFSRNLEYRHDTLVAVCQGRAVDFLNEFTSLEEPDLSQYISKLMSTSYTALGVCPMVTMHEFMVGYNTIAVEPWAPYLGLASKTPAERPEGAATGNPSTKPRVAVILGTAVFRKVDDAQRMVGYLDVEESMAGLLLNGTLEDGFLDIANPGDQAETTLHLYHESTTAKVDLNDGSVTVRIAIRVTAAIDESQVGIQEDETDQEFRKALVYTAQNQLVALLSRTFLKLTDLGSDVIGFGHEAQGKFASYQEWEAFDWRSKFRRAEATFDVKVHILTPGFTIQRPYPR